MNWTIVVWFGVGLLLGSVVGLLFWRRRPNHSKPTKTEGDNDLEAYRSRIKQLESALAKAELSIQEKTQRLHSAESQRSAIHAQYEISHARMLQFRDLLAEATNKLRLEHRARRDVEERVQGLDELVLSVQTQLVRMENDKKQLTAQLAEHVARLDESDSADENWRTRAISLQEAVFDLQESNDNLKRKLAIAENKLINFDTKSARGGPGLTIKPAF